MPLYRCTTAPGALTDRQRSTIARAITDIHTEVTGAPPTFVHVQFLDASDDPPAGDPAPISLHGGLRAGRPAAITEAIVDRCTSAVAEIAGVEPDRVAMRTSETPASWIFEGGRVFPEPGDEAAWQAGVGGGR
jgi:phenylpyruvate tautomerase PptA (4-oxalocrotonate tautomerase family)